MSHLFVQAHPEPNPWPRFVDVNGFILYLKPHQVIAPRGYDRHFEVRVYELFPDPHPDPEPEERTGGGRRRQYRNRQGQLVRNPECALGVQPDYIMLHLAHRRVLADLRDLRRFVFQEVESTAQTGWGRLHFVYTLVHETFALTVAANGGWFDDKVKAPLGTLFVVHNFFNILLAWFPTAAAWWRTACQRCPCCAPLAGTCGYCEEEWRAMAMAVPCCLPLFLPPMPAPVSAPAPAPAQEAPVHVPVLGDEDEAGHATWDLPPRIGQLPLTTGVRVTATHATHTATEEAEEEGVPAAQARPEVRLPGQSTEHLVEAQGGEGKRGERKAEKDDWETSATPTGTASGTGDIPAHAVAASSDVPAAARLPLGSDANAIGNGVSSMKGAEPRAHVVGDNDTTTGSKEATDDEQGTTKTQPKQAKQDGPLTATAIEALAPPLCADIPNDDVP